MENENQNGISVDAEELKKETQEPIENENQNGFSVDTEELKKETQETVNEVKETIKNVDFKKDTEEAKGFLKEMISNPFETIKKVATGEKNVLKNVIIIMVLYVLASFVQQAIYTLKRGWFDDFGDFLDKAFALLTSITYPVFYVLVPVVIILLLNRKNKKSLITVISTIVVTYIPIALAEVINVIKTLISGISIVTSPINTTLSAIAIIMSYFGIKELFGIEEHKDSIKTYALVKLIAAFVMVLLVNMGIA